MASLATSGSADILPLPQFCRTLSLHPEEPDPATAIIQSVPLIPTSVAKSFVGHYRIENPVSARRVRSLSDDIGIPIRPFELPHSLDGFNMALVGGPSRILYSPEDSPQEQATAILHEVYEAVHRTVGSNLPPDASLVPCNELDADEFSYCVQIPLDRAVGWVIRNGPNVSGLRHRYRCSYAAAHHTVVNAIGVWRRVDPAIPMYGAVLVESPSDSLRAKLGPYAAHTLRMSAVRGFPVSLYHSLDDESCLRRGKSTAKLMSLVESGRSFWLPGTDLIVMGNRHTVDIWIQQLPINQRYRRSAAAVVHFTPTGSHFLDKLVEQS